MASASPPNAGSVQHPVAIDPDGTEIGLVVVAKRSANHVPNPLSTHANGVLSDGTPIGYYASITTGELAASAAAPLAVGLVAAAAASLESYRGHVASYEWLRSHRLSQVDANEAKKRFLVSTLILIQATHQEAARFRGAWSRRANSPGHFGFIGRNCSTRASEAFVASGVLSTGIHGIDTPDGLFRQLRATGSAARKIRVFSGYIGFTPRRDRPGYLITVLPP